jgi:hypothetical protein
LSSRRPSSHWSPVPRFGPKGILPFGADQKGYSPLVRSRGQLSAPLRHAFQTKPLAPSYYAHRTNGSPIGNRESIRWHRRSRPQTPCTIDTHSAHGHPARLQVT